MMHKDELVRIGTITKTHGVSGEVNFQFTTDIWDTVEADHLMLIVDGLPVPFFMAEYRFRSDTTAIVSFLDIDTQEQAQELVGCEVWMERSLAAGHEDEYTWHTLVGYTIEGVGEITEVDDSTENVLFGVTPSPALPLTGEGDVKSPSDTILIPAAEDWIVEINHEAKIIRMNLPEGLIEINNPSPALPTGGGGL